MTRTARSAFPRAVKKDRSESKSGLDKSLRKNGAGMHNWGNIADEQILEFAALGDEEREFDDDDNESTISSPSDSLEGKRTTLEKSNSALTDLELETARNFRKIALKTDDLDLSAIARTSSAVSTSPKNVSPIQSIL